MREYNYDSIWISKAAESFPLFNGKRPGLSCWLLFGLPLSLAFLLFVAIRHPWMTSDFLVAYSLAVLWMNIGPILIWYYDERVFPDFFAGMERVVQDTDSLHRIAEKYDKFFGTQWVWFVIPWTVFVCYGYYMTTPILIPDGGILDANSLRYYASYLGTAWVGIVTGIGFTGVLTTLLVVRELSQQDLSLEPLHPDGVGGLSAVSRYAIVTTMLFSTGSLFLPLAFLITADLALMVLVNVAVFIFSGFVLASFLYPTIRVYLKARDHAETMMGKFNDQYEEIVRDLDDGQLLSRERFGMDAERDLEALSYVRDRRADYSSMNLYPFQGEIIFELVGSVLLPILFWVVDHFGVL